ncbi:unnamed protein product [Cylindrotheca closterium]|uniref:Uncharacterized protein n=1 Tax=Cylindrotheca closterium TaxID=2856 RepID=A0AAD2CJS5_9STRA|nr:unnamed protein product [Cylindrotheca closterium]
MLPPQNAATRPKSLVESVTPDQAPRTAPTARPPKRDGGTNAESITPSLTDTQGSGSQSDASTPSVFPIFRHPQQSPPSVPVKVEEFLSSLSPGDFFGDDHRCHLQSSTRLVFQNVNGIPALATGWKQQQINQWLKEEQVGIALLAETNTHWPSLLEGQHWNDSMRQVASKGYYSVAAHNENRARLMASCSQYGGCVATILNSVAHCAKSFGRDPTKLGRWAYVRVQGKKFAMPTPDDQVREASDASRSRFSRDLAVVSAYRPNPPGTGESTVWAQHQSFFRSQGRLREPREAFMVDLLRAITQWRDEGCDEDISSTKSSSF